MKNIWYNNHYVKTLYNTWVNIKISVNFGDVKIKKYINIFEVANII